MKVPAWVRGKGSAPKEALSAVHRTYSSSERRYVLINDEGLTFNEWLAAAGIEESTTAQVPVLEKAWKDGEDPTEWRARRGKPAKGWKVDNDLEGVNDKRPFNFTIESDDWDAAARKVIETINGYGDFHFDSLQDALDSGPYATSKEFVLEHLHWLKYYYEVYEGSKIRNVFDRRFR